MFLPFRIKRNMAHNISMSQKSAARVRTVQVDFWSELPPYDYVDTPSVQQGLSTEAETNLRIWGCQFIQSTGQLLQCPQVSTLKCMLLIVKVVMASAQVLFQRFFCRKSFLHNRVEVRF
jgi:hypothetical protein